jgi:NAD(P)-dependent dehydrogenase (short-subunit alcohol dehydrogenase family)
VTTGRLDGRVAIVTGGGNGLGRAYCHYLGAHGASVVVSDLDTDAASAVADEVSDAGGEACAVRHDVSDWAAAGKTLGAAIDRYGEVDVVVNNAGNARRRVMADVTEDDWDALVDVHLKGAAAMSAAAMAYWRRVQRDASIIHITSVAGLTGVPGTGPYSAAKMGVIGLSKTLAAEGASFGVRSNVVSPVAHTALTSATHPVTPHDDSDYFAGDPANVAPLVGWLAEVRCPANDQIFHVVGTQVLVLSVPVIASVCAHEPCRWTSDEFDTSLAPMLVEPVRRETMLNELVRSERA